MQLDLNRLKLYFKATHFTVTIPFVMHMKSAYLFCDLDSSIWKVSEPSPSRVLTCRFPVSKVT